jgi:hypothetical protein
LYTRSGEQRTTSNAGSLDALIGRPLPLRLHALFIIPWLFQVRRPIVSSGDAIFFFVFLFFLFFRFLPFSPLFPTALHCTARKKKKNHTHTHTHHNIIRAHTKIFPIVPESNVQRRRSWFPRACVFHSLSVLYTSRHILRISSPQKKI